MTRNVYHNICNALERSPISDTSLLRGSIFSTGPVDELGRPEPKAERYPDTSEVQAWLDAYGCSIPDALTIKVY